MTQHTLRDLLAAAQAERCPSCDTGDGYNIADDGPRRCPRCNPPDCPNCGEQSDEPLDRRYMVCQQCVEQRDALLLAGGLGV